MFGMGFTEILFIAVVAILFLGPDKLPEAMVQIAKLFKSIKSTINEAKSSFEEEIHIKELREEALNYRKQFENAANDISGFKNSIPNPAAELQDAISTIGGDRYLDEDILADIEEAKSRSEEAALIESADSKPTGEEPIKEKPTDKKTSNNTQKPDKKPRNKKNSGKSAEKSKAPESGDKA